MIKQNFTSYLNNLLNGKSLETQTDILVTLDEIVHNYYDNLQEYFTVCPYCKRSSLKEDFILEQFIEIREDVFLDCSTDPNDDEEVYGVVKYAVATEECPKCRNKHEIKREELQILKQYMR